MAENGNEGARSKPLLDPTITYGKRHRRDSAQR
jgi:hypothetical protein